MIKLNAKQKTRLLFVLSLIILLSTASALILYSLKQNINLFYTPTQLLQAQVTPEQHLRIGGYVKKNSVQYDTSGESVRFIVTDRVKEIPVTFHGVLPNLFREGQTIVATGTFNTQHIFIADEVLAKHDEKYMPQSLKDLKKGEGYGS